MGDIRVRSRRQVENDKKQRNYRNDRNTGNYERNKNERNDQTSSELSLSARRFVFRQASNLQLVQH